MSWKPIKFKWQWRLESSPQALWPYAADTQRFDQAVGLPPVLFTETPLEIGGSRLFGRSSKLGVAVEWEEEPYEWIREQEYSVVRHFKRGPLAYSYNRMLLEPDGGGTRVTYFIEATPANFLGLPAIYYQVGWESRRSFERAFRQMDAFIQGRSAQPFDLQKTAIDNAGWTRLVALAEQLSGQGYDRRWVHRLVDAINHEGDLNLLRLRPYVLADAWQAPRREILEMFLSAARLGVLALRWDVICPLCRIAKGGGDSLAEMPTGVHCATCNIEYDADFSQNVELTFSPHPQLRTIFENVTCIGGPMVTPHILVHQNLKPGETRSLRVKVEPGGYRLRTQRPGVEAWLDLDPSASAGGSHFSVRAGEDALQVEPRRIEEPRAQDDGGYVTLTLANSAPYAQRLYVERASWYTDAVTAAQVTALQHFRDLFSDEVLRPGDEIGVQGMTILFTDLVGSTAMYNRRGDAPSYALVREQFAFLQRIVQAQEGAIVKTIGDAVMAAFVDPARGVGAALAIQDQVHAFNAAHPAEPLRIKVGLHHGPCIAVNLNGRLDYFGTTVNLAARLEGQSRGGDVVISEGLWRDPVVQELLGTMPVEVERFETAIKGFDEHFILRRLTLARAPEERPLATALRSG
ncbi:MAG: adenylate/guanylate cyclase domain-containing protein [Anaerolineae bacterium]